MYVVKLIAYVAERLTLKIMYLVQVYTCSLAMMTVVICRLDLGRVTPAGNVGGAI